MTGRHGTFPGDDDEDALPWLEPAEADYDDAQEPRFPARGLIIASLLVVAVIALLWFVAAKFGGEDAGMTASNGEIPVIDAPDGPYKVKPTDPGGLDVRESQSVTHAVAEGEDPGSTIAVDAQPEEPVPLKTPRAAPPVASVAVPPVNDDAAVKRPPTPQPKVPRPVVEPETKVETPKPAPPKPAPPKPVVESKPVAAASGGSVVQLGAFSDTATANAVWSKLSGRLSTLSGLRKSIEPVDVGGKTLYRLRASGLADRAAADALCSQAKSAGEQCAVVR